MPKQNQPVSKHIANLIEYAKENLNLNYYDAIYAQNSLLALLKQTEPAQADAKLPDFQTGIIDKIVDYAVENGIVEKFVNFIIVFLIFVVKIRDVFIVFFTFIIEI
mgnify:CR=1 FL=1